MSSSDTIRALCMGPILEEEVSTDNTLNKVASLRLKIVDRMLHEAGDELPNKGMLDTMRGYLADAEKSVFNRRRSAIEEGVNNTNNKLIQAFADSLGRARPIPGSRTTPVSIDTSVLDGIHVATSVMSREATNMTSKSFLESISNEDE